VCTIIAAVETILVVGAVCLLFPFKPRWVDIIDLSKIRVGFT
jgi:hypothetical protein